MFPIVPVMTAGSMRSEEPPTLTKVREASSRGPKSAAMATVLRRLGSGYAVLWEDTEERLLPYPPLSLLSTSSALSLLSTDGVTHLLVGVSPDWDLQARVETV